MLRNKNSISIDSQGPRYFRRLGRIVARVLAVLAVSSCVSGCIAAACITIAAVGVALCASNSGSGGEQSLPRYLYAKVDSGRVSQNLELKNRYRISATRIVRHTQQTHAADDFVNSLACEAGGHNDIQPELEAMFPGVFFSGEDSVGIIVEFHVKKVHAHPMAKFLNCMGAGVVVKNACTGRVLGTDGFEEVLGWYDRVSNNVHVVSDWQTYREEDEVAIDGCLKHAIFEGFAASIVATLDKYENGGVRQDVPGDGPRFVDVEVGKQNGATDQRESSETPNDDDVDNSVEAINFFMGSMGAINAVQQQRHMRNQARRMRKQSQHATQKSRIGNTANTCTSSGYTVGGSSEKTSRTCPVCGGNTKCRPCNGSGYIAAAATIAATSSSPMRSAMAGQRVKCRACDGTGKCRTCEGTGRR